MKNRSWSELSSTFSYCTYSCAENTHLTKFIAIYIDIYMYNVYIKSQIEYSEVQCRVKVNWNVHSFGGHLCIKESLEFYVIARRVMLQCWHCHLLTDTENAALICSFFSLLKQRSVDEDQVSLSAGCIFTHPVRFWKHFVSFLPLFFTFFFQCPKLFKHLEHVSSVAVKAVVLPAVIRCLFSKCKWRQYVKSVSFSVLNKCFVQIYPGMILHGIWMCWSKVEMNPPHTFSRRYHNTRSGTSTGS